MNKLKKLFYSLIFDRRRLYLYLLYKFSHLFSDETFLRLLFKLSMGKVLNLDNPQTFSEKLQWLKLYNRKPEYTQMVDKYEAKKYVANIIGDEYIIPTLGVWDNVDDIDFDSLPNQFVLKCTHDSGGLVICKDKSKLDVKSAKKKLARSLKHNYYYQNREWPYKNVKPRIIAEQFLVDESGYELKDYKFFCFDANPKYCQIISGRATRMCIDFFDENWAHQPFHEPAVYPFSKNEIKKPSRFDKMLELASVLSANIPFVRIDFYNIKGEIYFGEITFFPTSGMGGFDPEEWDYTFGSWIKLPVGK